MISIMTANYIIKTKYIQMKRLYFFKWPLAIFLTGYLLQIIGALVKIRHWPGADELLTFGMITMCEGVLFAIVKLFILKKLLNNFYK
jgi:hypothetical protein